MVERGGDEARSVSEAVHPFLADAHLIGVTGSPGAGKSTLTSALCTAMRSRGERVAVLAIDPSSPFTGGAILGDRIRMGEHALDDGVFIRSMATRGHLGGLSVATPEAARVLEVVGFDRIIVETVGVGQVEVEVAGAADTTVVVVNPGWGDAVQAAKAGLMEIADIFVINKADRPGAGETRRDIEAVLTMAEHSSWAPPVIDTVASAGDGVEDLLDSLDEHRRRLAESGEGARRRGLRAESEIRSLVAARLAERAASLCDGGTWESLLGDVLAGRIDPWAATDHLLGSADR
jgi:LAO/AO transport system kinase